MVRIEARLSEVVCKAFVICFPIVSIVLYASGSEKSSSKFANSVCKVEWKVSKVGVFLLLKVGI